MVVVHLCYSKEDPFSAGYLGCTGRTLFPVSTMLGYPSICSSNLGPLHVCVRRGHPLVTRKVDHPPCAALSTAGISTANFSGHSFKIGAASTVARAGFSDSFIQTLGRWKSAAFTTYIRTHSYVSKASLLAMTEHAPGTPSQPNHWYSDNSVNRIGV